MEIWKDVKEFEGSYKVSNYGRVFGIKKGNILKLYQDQRGYLRANLTNCGERKNARVHRLVAEAFIQNPNNYDSVNHIDENKTNNNVSNLEWCTTKYNNSYGTAKVRASKNTCKKVGQYYLDGNLVKIWNSISETKNFGYSTSAISSCCTGRPHYNSHKGFIWKFI